MKRIIFLLYILIACSYANAMDQIISASTAGTSLTVGSNNFMSIDAVASSFGTSEAAIKVAPSIGGRFSNLNVILSGSPGAGKSYTIVLRVNSADTALTCTISDSATTCSDVSNIVTYAAEDFLAWNVTSANTPTARAITITAKLTTLNGDIRDSVMVNSIGTAQTWPNSATNYTIPQGDVSPNSTEGNRQIVMPVSGKFKNLFMKTKNAGSPGSGKSYVYTLRKNGADTALTCTISNTSTNCRDRLNVVSVAAGDLISISGAPSGTPTALQAGVSLVFEADQQNTFVKTMHGSGASTSTTNYIGLTGSLTAFQTTSQGALLSNLYLRSLYAHNFTAPGGSALYTFTLYNGTTFTPTSYTCTISASSTDCNYTPSRLVALSTSVNQYTTTIFPSGTPASSRMAVSYALTLVPQTGATIKTTTVRNATIAGN